MFRDRQTLRIEHTDLHEVAVYLRVRTDPGVVPVRIGLLLGALVALWATLISVAVGAVLWLACSAAVFALRRDLFPQPGWTRMDIGRGRVRVDGKLATALKLSRDALWLDVSSGRPSHGIASLTDGEVARIYEMVDQATRSQVVELPLELQALLPETKRGGTSRV